MSWIKYIAQHFDPRDMIGQVSRKPKPVKQCLNCDKSHNHNNSFCSAKCCKEKQFG